MQTINLDLSKKSIIPLLHAKQGDVGKKFMVTITDDGNPYDLDGAVFSVWYAGTSGEGNYTHIGEKSAFLISGNAVTVELIAQMLTNIGDGTLCLVMNTAEGGQIGMWNIPYCVEMVPGADSAEAEAYYTAFQQTVADIPYPDISLSVSGKAADAAAVGAALSAKANAEEVEEGLQDLNRQLQEYADGLSSDDRQYIDGKLASLVQSGTWTPVILSGADNLVGFSGCTYHKTGNIVHVGVTCWGTFTNRNSDALILSLPFPVGSIRSYGSFGYSNCGLADLYIFAGGGTSQCEIKQHNASGQETTVTGTSIGRDAWTFQFSLTYATDA